MDIKSVYDIAGRAMAAQLVRLNTVASNLANAGSTTGDPKTTYRPLKPIFETKIANVSHRLSVPREIIFLRPIDSLLKQKMA